MTDSQTLNAAIIAGAVTIVVTIIGNVINVYTNRLSRKNDHKLAILKVLLEAAYKEYEFRTKQDIDAALVKGVEPQIKSFTEYIIFYKELSELFAQSNIRRQDLINSLEKNKQLIDTYYEEREIFRPDYHKTPKSKGD